MSSDPSPQEHQVEQPQFHIPTQPRTWKGGVEQYLAENGIVYDKVEPLQSGTSCYLWHIDGLDGSHGQPAVLKVADSTPKFDDRPLAADRLQSEVKALSRSQAVDKACSTESSVRVPRVLRTTKNGFIMTWAGDRDLRTAYKTDETDTLDAKAIGTRLGRWLASLHLAGVEAGPDGWPEENSELRQFYVAGGVEESVVRGVFGTDEDQIQRVLAVLRTPDRVRTLTPWDFRPMNTLLHGELLTIVDWELCHYGEPSSDIRMWAAEAMIMEAKFGERGLLSSFLSAYARAIAGLNLVDETFVRKVAAAVGVLTLFLMSVGPQVWDCSGEEDINRWKGTAVEFIRAGADGDLNWIKQSCLGPLLELTK